MRKSLGTLALIVIVVAVIGMSRDWFDLERRAEGETTEVQLRIDRERIRNDTRKAAEAAREFRENLGRKTEAAQSEEALERSADSSADSSVQSGQEQWQ